MKNTSLIILILCALAAGCSFSRGGSQRVRNKVEQIKEQERQSQTVENSDGATTSATNGASLNELISLVSEAQRLLRTGDKSGVAKLYAEDYTGVYADGDKTTKNDLLDRARDNPKFVSVKIENAKLLYSNASTAEMSCDMVVKLTDETQTYRGTWSFVNRNGSWQIKGWRGSLF